MKNIFASSTLLFVSAALFAAGLISQNDKDFLPTAPSNLTIPVEVPHASGPTIPPIEDETTGGTKVASGPTIPPIEDETTGGTKVASGPTIPPIEDETTGETKLV